MRIGIFEDTCVVTGKHHELMNLDEALCFVVTDHVPRRMRGWDGKRHFFNWNTQSFPHGFLSFVMRVAKEEKWKVTLKDLRKRKTTESVKVLRWSKIARPRGYQAKGGIKFLRNYVGGIHWPKGVIEAPTGAGKTLMEALVAACYPGRVIVLVHLRTLMFQVKDAFEKYLGEKVGCFGEVSNERFGLTNRVVIAMVQSLDRNRTRKPVKRWLARHIGMVIVDECHHVSKGKYWRLLKLIGAQHRLGFSASCFRKHNIADAYLMASLGDLLYRQPKEPLFQKGILARPTFIMPIVRQPRIMGGNFPSKYKRGIVENRYRNSLIADWAVDLVQSGHYPLILVRLIRHGEILEDAIDRRLGGGVVFLSGRDPVPYRKEILERFGAHKLPVLIASTIFDEGIDVPALDAEILAGAGKSEVKAIQRPGRGMRGKQGENRVLIIHPYDQTCASLEEHSAESQAIYQGEGHHVRIVPGDGLHNLWQTYIQKAPPTP